MKKLKILELTSFSAGACGVFSRVLQESTELKKLGHEVRIFSSNLEKGTNKKVPSKDKINGIEITRFPAEIIGGESYMRWDFDKVKKLAYEFHPDIIIAHAYRHTHTKIGLDIAKKINTKCFLVTHAPFNRGSSRSFLAKFYIRFIDDSQKKLKEFDKVIAITKWEYPYLEKLGVRKDKIVYIPNGIPDLFFKQKPSKLSKEQNKILFLGRISPIKNLETLIRAISIVQQKNKKAILEIVGPAEEDYKIRLLHLIKELKLENKIVFSPAIYDLKKKIQKIDSCKVFVLPSISEGMPQSLIEAMARKKIVISSNNLGGKDLIENNQNGFLFEVGNYNQLADIINKSLASKDKTIENNAKKSVEKFNWSILIKDLNNLFY